MKTIRTMLMLFLLAVPTNISAQVSNYYSVGVSANNGSRVSINNSFNTTVTTNNYYRPLYPRDATGYYNSSGYVYVNTRSAPLVPRTRVVTPRVLRPGDSGYYSNRGTGVTRDSRGRIRY